MPPSRRIELTDEEDEKLREVEQNPHLRNKVRLRAQVLRLSGRGSNMAQIASYTGRSPTSIARDLDRWEERGLEGLADGAAPGNPPRVTEGEAIHGGEALARSGRGTPRNWPRL